MSFYLRFVAFDFLYTMEFSCGRTMRCILCQIVAGLYSTRQTHNTCFLYRSTIWRQAVIDAPEEQLQSLRCRFLCANNCNKPALERGEHWFHMLCWQYVFSNNNITDSSISRFWSSVIMSIPPLHERNIWRPAPNVCNFNRPAYVQPVTTGDCCRNLVADIGCFQS